MSEYGEQQRAKAEARGVLVLMQYERDHDPGEEADVVARDLFADLMHAARGRFDFMAEWERAKDHFFQELREANE